MHTKSWNSVLPSLLDHYDILLYDYIGRGQSTSVDEPASSRIWVTIFS
jgi:hypothetical protein